MLAYWAARRAVSTLPCTIAVPGTRAPVFHVLVAQSLWIQHMKVEAIIKLIMHVCTFLPPCCVNQLFSNKLTPLPAGFFFAKPFKKIVLAGHV